MKREIELLRKIGGKSIPKQEDYKVAKPEVDVKSRKMPNEDEFWSAAGENEGTSPADVGVQSR